VEKQIAWLMMATCCSF